MNQPNWVLEPLEAIDANGSLQVHRSSYRIGRKSELELSINDQTVSGLHAILLSDNGGLFVSDQQSTNGTFLNGRTLGSESTQLHNDDILQLASVAFRVVNNGETLVDEETVSAESRDDALAVSQLERLLVEGCVPYFQPIVKLASEPAVYGYEVLCRSRLVGLETPQQMFQAASRLNLEAELSRTFREQGVKVGSSLDTPIFVNTHPVEFETEAFLRSMEEIRKRYASQKIVVEIHETAVTNPGMMYEIKFVLDQLDIKLAFDDFGAGQARLIELGEIRPDYMKFDIKLVRGIHGAAPSRQEVLVRLVELVLGLGIIPLAEGVETAEEHETLHQMGFVLGQGYFYGKPKTIDRYQLDLV